MNEAILFYPIGEVEQESVTLETLKSLIADEATRLLCVGGDSWGLRIYMNSYRLAKEKRL